MRLPVLAAPLRVIAAAAALAPATALSQVADTAGPRRGNWAAEAEVGGGFGASVLRFRSERSAWRVGLSFSLATQRREYEPAPFEQPPAERSTFALVDLRLGARRYGAAGSRLRPIGGAGVFGSYARFESDQVIWGAGAFGEAGAAYFFTPHVSLAAAGEARAFYDEQHSGSLRVRRLGVSGTLVRVIGAVYF